MTVMKVDSHLQIDPSTVCVVDAKSAFDHLLRESTKGAAHRGCGQKHRETPPLRGQHGVRNDTITTITLQ